MGSELCEKPPKGWRCTRDAGHDGPCAAVSKTDDPYAPLRESDQAYAEGVRDGRRAALEEAIATVESYGFYDPTSFDAMVKSLKGLPGMKGGDNDG